MAIVVGADLHRQQITFDALDTVTGVVETGRIAPANRETLRAWLAARAPVTLTVEATTGWRYVAEETVCAGGSAKLAEPADTRALRGPKRRAKNDRLDARHLRVLTAEGRLPESWIAPSFLLDLRASVRHRHTTADLRGAAQQRIHAVLFHAGVPVTPGGGLLRADTRCWVQARSELSDAARLQVASLYRIIDAYDHELDVADRALRSYARRHPACIALAEQWGVGFLIACALYAEIGDARRFRASNKLVRYAGIDITVNDSDRHHGPGRLSRQGSPVLRWAAYEGALSASRPASPDHARYRDLRKRLAHREATLTISRRVLERTFHTLVAVGDATLQDAPATAPRAV